MGHDHHRHALARQQLHDLQHLPHQLGVQRGSGLVKQHDLGLHGQRPGNGHPLLLAAGQAGRHGMGFFGQAHLLQQRHGFGLRLFPGNTAHLARADGDVVNHRQVGKQVERLEHHADIFPQMVKRHLAQHPAVVDQRASADLDPALLGCFQPVATAQESTFPGPAGPDDHHHLRGLNIEINAFQHGVVAKRLAQAAYADNRLFAFHCTMPPARSRCSMWRSASVVNPVRTKYITAMAR